MPAPRLFVNGTLTPHSELTLSGEAARYIGRVLRCRRDDALVLFDGSGPEYTAVIGSVTRQAVSVQVGEAMTRDVESPLDVRLLQGISRGERMDTVMQKATELGARRITPLFTEFSVVRLDAERAAKRRAHWQRVCESACEQCGRNGPPAVDLPCTFEAMLGEPADDRATRLLLEPDAADPLSSLELQPARVELLIGPEGGISEPERQLAVARGFVPVSIGPRVLRTETAAIAALTLVQSLWGDLGKPA